MEKLTQAQRRILNRLGRYDPSWRDFELANSKQFGDIFGETQDTVEEIETRVIQIETTGAADGANIVRTTLLATDSFPITLLSISNIRFISEVCVKVKQVFQSSTTVSLGTDGNPELLFSSSESDLNELFTFTGFPKSEVDEDIKIFINNPGSSGEIIVSMTVK